MKNLSIKLKDDLILDTEKILSKIRKNRNGYINEAIELYNRLHKRRLLSKQLSKESKSVSAAKLKADLKKLIESEVSARLDYIEFFEPDTLSPVSKVTRGAHMSLAVFLGKTRLIDNAILQ